MVRDTSMVLISSPTMDNHKIVIIISLPFNTGVVNVLGPPNNSKDSDNESQIGKWINGCWMMLMVVGVEFIHVQIVLDQIHS